MECKSCRSKNVVENDTNAEIVCEDCGWFCEIDNYKGEIEFHETSNGSKVPVGCLILTGFPAAKQHTINKAKDKINVLCNKLCLEPYVGSYALEIYKSAFMRGLTKGRPALIVAGACLYLASRLKHQSVMLLDISDKINVNVYVLGKTYSVIKESFGQKLQDIDPCLFINRFAARMELGDKTAIVSMTALKLLQRMKKDWISTGRRPCGVTAAALLLAAKIHHFDRHYEDVARIAGVSEITCRKRLEEWARTPTANLTLSEFQTIDFEEEFDPPAFTGQNLKPKLSVPEITEKQFIRIKQDILEMKQKIEEETNQNDTSMENNFSNLLSSVEEDGEIPLDLLLGDIDSNPDNEDLDFVEEINGRRNMIKECINSKVVRNLFTNFSKSEVCITNPVCKLDQLPLVLPISDCDGLVPIDSNAEFDMTDIDDAELISTYILSHEESVKKLRWFYKTNKDYYRNKKSTQVRKAEKLKRIQDSSKKPRTKRQKRGAEFMVTPDEVLREIKPSYEGSETKIMKLSPGKEEVAQSSQNSPMKCERDYPPSEDDVPDGESDALGMNDNYDADD